MYQILAKKALNKDVDYMEIEAPLICKNARPGHFLIVRVDEDGERVPLTIVDHSDTTVAIIYQKVGYSTKLLGEKQVGEFISDCVGPLGKPSHIRDKNHIIGIAGGVGAAPLYPQLKEYKARGIKVDLILGARSKDYIILEKEYREFCDHVYIVTDDGSYGDKGKVTDKLKSLLETEMYNQAIAIGPAIMMKFTVLLAKENNLPIDVSLNPIMIDGTGMCGNCRVSIAGKTFFACIDGPDFPGEEIDFDELMARQSHYKKEEHDCHLRMVKNHD